MLLRFLFTAVVVAFTAIAMSVYLPTTDSATSGLLLSSVRSASAGASTLSKNAGSSAPTVQVLASYPHDPDAFTQGLFVAKQGNDKFFIESTGLFGKSTLRKVAIESGEVLAKYDLPTDLFGEGVTLSENGEVVMLTWKSRKGFVFHVGSSSAPTNDALTFSLTREFAFSTVTGEGWGIDSNGSHLLVTDGSSTIMFWDPKTMREVRRIDVRFQNRAISQLNEIEFANGFIYANIWFQAVIVKIDPQSGDIVSVFDCAQLMDPSITRGDHNAVLNGIAYDADEDVFYVTGKLWNTVYKVRLLG
uniref:Glutamine cyclotransferase n=1 Tax=Globisporangium ultimum (strain ATCC 200006 / CBS 805.95 / DAOM BR144) TaxID=431595 RepID=K3WSH2_GLOUD